MKDSAIHEATLLAVLQDSIDLTFSLLDGHRSADRSHAGFSFAVGKSDFVSPTTALSN
jgi:hypothetical protein